MMMRKGSTRGRAESFSPKVKRVPMSSKRKFLRLQSNSAHAMNMAVSIRPGMTPARNSRPMEVSVAMPYTIIVTEGGMRMPSVPPAQMEPVATDAG